MDISVGKRRLAILDVKDPCPEDWSAMEGDVRERHCALCEQSVYDLSEMSAAEAEELLARPGRVCVRFYRRADGRVTTKDCTPFRVRAARAVTRATMRGAARLASLTIALLVLLGFGSLTGLNPMRWLAGTFGPTMGEPVLGEIGEMTMGTPAPGEPQEPSEPREDAPSPKHGAPLDEAPTNEGQSPVSTKAE